MHESIGIFLCVLVGFIGGIYTANGITEGNWTTKYAEKSYCEAQKIRDTEYKRCWKSVEVKP